MIIIAALSRLGKPALRKLYFHLRFFCTENCDVRGVSGGALNWSPLMSRDASLSDSYKSVGGGFPVYTEKTSIPFPFKLNGIWSWCQFSFRF